MAQRWFILALATVAAVAVMTEAATKHVVGGSTGWTIPSSSSFYSQWASPQTFAVGDTLVFNFTTGMHNVVEVPKSSYDSCSPSKQIGSTLTAGPATVTLTKPGSHYYICGVAGHCSIGQKLAVTVAPATSSSSPAPAPSAGAPASAPPSPAPAPSAVSPATAPSTSHAAPATSPSSPAPAPSAVSPATAPAASPAAAIPAGPPAPSSRSGPTMGPTADNQNPTAVAGPAGGGPGTSSATSLSLSAGIAAVVSAAAAFLL